MDELGFFLVEKGYAGGTPTLSFINNIAFALHVYFTC